MRLLALLLVVAGCYRTPSPPCAFLCGPDDSCPVGYECRGDNRCHNVMGGECDELPMPDALIIDAGPPDAPVDAAEELPDAAEELPDAAEETPDAA
jgi:hypothetical protein